MSDFTLSDLEIRIRRELGLSEDFFGKYVPPSDARTAEMVRMYQRGETLHAVGAYFGLSSAAARYWLKKAAAMGDAPPKPREVARRERLALQMEQMAAETRKAPVGRSFAKFRHASDDTWTPERMWHQLRYENGA